MARYNREVTPFLRKTLNHRRFTREEVMELKTESDDHIGFITKHVSPLLAKYDKYFQFQSTLVVLSGDSFDQRTDNMSKFAEDVKLNWPVLAKQFGFQIRDLGWRNELYTVYPMHQHPLKFKTKVVNIERGMCKFLGIETFGVHVNCFTRKPDGLYIWVGRRSPTKTTFPNLIDQCVAGKSKTGT